MLEHHNITSEDQYAELLIEALGSEELDPVQQEFMPFWYIEIRKKCNEKYQDYILGTEETFILTDEELDETHNKAIDNVVSISLSNLSDKGMLDISINEDGDMLFGLSDKGKQFVEENK